MLTKVYQRLIGADWRRTRAKKKDLYSKMAEVNHGHVTTRMSE